MKKQAQRVAESTKVRFAAIGVINTLIDFALLNVFAHAMGIPRIPSNIMSASVAMVFSFFANRTVVFRGHDGDARSQALKFIAVTVSSVYIIQNIVIYLLTEVWLWPLETAHDIIGILEQDVFITNGAKAAATVASLIWNFVLYDKVVFTRKDGDGADKA